MSRYMTAASVYYYIETTVLCQYEK